MRDPTGSRRFWPIAVGSIDLEAIERDRDQLWAEAVVLYDGGAGRWWLDEDESLQLEQASETFTEVDPWSDLIAEWVTENPTQTFTTAQLLDRCLEKPKERITRRDEMRCAAILRSFGFDKRRMMVEGHRRHVWHRE